VQIFNNIITFRGDNYFKYGLDYLAKNVKEIGEKRVKNKSELIRSLMLYAIIKGAVPDVHRNRFVRIIKNGS